MVKFYGESGNVYREWDDIGKTEKLVKVEVELFDTKEQPYFVLEGYDKYMFQKYGTTVIGSRGADFNAFSGIQVGGFKEAVGWFVINIDFSSNIMTVQLSKQITSIAKKEGVLL